MDGDTSFLKARDLAVQAGLPEADVKRYLRTYGEFITSTKQGRSRLYPPGTADLLKQIADLEAVGTTVPTIRNVLMAGQAEEGHDAGTGSVIPAGFAAAGGEALTLGALSDIKALQETLGELREEVAVLREKLAEHEHKIIGHQQQIRLLRHDVDEYRTDALARKVEGRTPPIWRRILPGSGGPRR